MELDFTAAYTDLTTERVLINTRQAPAYCHVQNAGDPVTGGSLNARQDGDQYTLRFKVVDYPDPQVHDKLKTVNYGTLRMKQRFREGDLWACLCTGLVRGRHD